MCGGGGDKPETPEATAEQVAESGFSVNRAQTHGRVYAPIEKRAVEKAFNPDVELAERSGLRARSNADVMQMEAANAQGFAPSVGQGTAHSALSDSAQASANAQGQAFKGADAQAQERTTQRQLNVVRTGEGKASTVLTGLKAQSQMASETAMNKLRIKQLEAETKMKNINTLASSAVSAYGIHKAKGFAEDVKQGFSPYMNHKKTPTIHGSGVSSTNARPNTGLRYQQSSREMIA